MFLSLCDRLKQRGNVSAAIYRRAFAKLEAIFLTLRDAVKFMAFKSFATAACAIIGLYRRSDVRTQCTKLFSHANFDRRMRLLGPMRQMRTRTS